MPTPQFINRTSMLADSDYVQWLSELKQRYRQSQAKAAVHVNHGMLEFYWLLGRDIVALKAESKWGSDFYNRNCYLFDCDNAGIGNRCLCAYGYCTNSGFTGACSCI